MPGKLASTKGALKPPTKLGLPPKKKAPSKPKAFSNKVLKPDPVAATKRLRLIRSIYKKLDKHVPWTSNKWKFMGQVKGLLQEQTKIVSIISKGKVSKVEDLTDPDGILDDGGDYDGDDYYDDDY